MGIEIRKQNTRTMKRCHLLHLLASLLVGVFLTNICYAQLTGIWTDDGGSRYRIRQVDNHIFWSVDASPSVINVYHGIIAGNIITGRWADVPDGEKKGSGTLALKVENPNRMVKIASDGNYGATVWTRVGTAPVTGEEEPTAPINLPQPPPTTSSPNAIQIPGAVDIAVSSTDIWVSHGEWGIYKIPLNTRKPQSFDSRRMAKFIAVNQNNQPWIVGTDNKVYYHDGSSWRQTNSGNCKDICIDKHNRAWTIDYGWMVKYYDTQNAKWIATDKRDGRALAVIDENYILHADFYMNVSIKQNGTWIAVIDKRPMDDLAMNASGKIWGKDREGKICEYVDGKWTDHEEYGLAKRIAVSPSGEAYSIKVEKK